MVEFESEIRKKLKDLNINFDSLKIHEKERLVEIEGAILKIRNERDEAIRLLSLEPYNLKTIANLIGCSRTTFYNNKILKTYIEYSLTLEDKNNPVVLLEKCRKAKTRTDEKLTKMLLRDVDMINLMHENSILRDELTESQECNDRLLNTMKQLKDENLFLIKKLEKLTK